MLQPTGDIRRVDFVANGSTRVCYCAVYCCNILAFVSVANFVVIGDRATEKHGPSMLLSKGQPIKLNYDSLRLVVHLVRANMQHVAARRNAACD